MTTILVGTDTSAAGDLAVDDAARLARDRGAELLVLYVRGGDAAHTVVDPTRAADPRSHLERLTRRFPEVDAVSREEAG